MENIINQSKVQLVKDIILPAIHANHVVNFTFVKKDGSIREMRLMRSKKLEGTVTGTAPAATEARKWTLDKRGMMAVEELTADHKFQFRTINLNTCTRVAADGKVLTFN